MSKAVLKSIESRIVEQRVDKVVEQQSDHRRRNTGDDYLEPEIELIALNYVQHLSVF